ncbi:hypothetical protein WH50_19295 [Pokkaliibacter plantistimulans]|uniref:DUF4123 domain-containing protein n=1 Tax=Pokkaliibacter plantistimulans TaxID=1635171 RepID=A0ABX5LVQ1_9GAMM|nr:DUF4123 domain-containing protein [Pokkaliibacter plantistimulans]PXF29690.1 hypothetical protein WH50_19295 [Pokkaliibacter plantistimulans]
MTRIIPPPRPVTPQPQPITSKILRQGYAFAQPGWQLPLQRLPLHDLKLALLIDTPRLWGWLTIVCDDQHYLGWDGLYENTPLDDTLDDCSPTLVGIQHDADLFQRWLNDPDWARGALLISYRCEREVLVNHLRSLVWMKQRGKDLLMRYYAPDILDSWASTLTDDELDALLGPAECWAWLSPLQHQQYGLHHYHWDTSLPRCWSWMAHTPTASGAVVKSGSSQVHNHGWFHLSEAQIDALDRHDAVIRQREQAARGATATTAFQNYIDDWLGAGTEDTP